ncbi:hypothetical protein GCM10010415_16600 [Streptomyces atrovirens]
MVKTNAPKLLRHRPASPDWQGEHIGTGTNVDFYQRAEGRYRLMPGVLAALRDLPLLKQAAEVTDVGVSVSVGFTDEGLWRTVEPGTPSPERRPDVVRTFTGHGIDCGVLMAPVIPFLSDRPDQLRAAVRAVAASNATSVTPLVLHLRPGAREWFMSWLGRHHPYLVARYQRLYADGAYAPKWYRRRITRQVHELAQEHGIGPTRAETPRRIRAAGPAGRPAAEPTQLALL